MEQGNETARTRRRTGLARIAVLLAVMAAALVLPSKAASASSIAVTSGPGPYLPGSSVSINPNREDPEHTLTMGLWSGNSCSDSLYVRTEWRGDAGTVPRTVTIPATIPTETAYQGDGIPWRASGAATSGNSTIGLSVGFFFFGDVPSLVCLGPMTLAYTSPLTVTVTDSSPFPGVPSGYSYTAHPVAPIPSGGVTYEYQWWTGAQINIAGATSQVLEVTESLVAANNFTVGVTVTAKQQGYADQVVSTTNQRNLLAVTPRFDDGVTAFVYAPGVESPTVGSPVTAQHIGANPGFFGGELSTFEWRTNGTPNGGTGPSYVPLQSDLNQVLSVQITSENYFGAFYRSTVSGAAGTVSQGFTTPPTVTISGNPVTGSTLTAVVTGGNPDQASTTKTYEWLRFVGEAPIGTGPTFTPTVQQYLHPVRFRVTLVSGSRKVVVTSEPVTIGKGTHTLAAPTFTGSPVVGQRLACTPPPGIPVGLYEWRRGAIVVNVNGSDLYTVQAADVGHQLECRITWQDYGYHDAVSSVFTPMVTGASFSIDPPTVTGDPKPAVPLTCAAAPGTPGLVTYAWTVNGAAAGTGASFRPRTADVGHPVTCVVTATQAGYAEAATASATTPTAVVPGDPQAPNSDFDGDGDSDLAVYRPSTGTWYVLGQATVSWGLATDVPVAGDWDGDGRTDRAVYRPSNGGWYVEGRAPVYFGTAGDIPVPGDYDADGTLEPAVFRPSNGRWYVLGQPTVAWGIASDIPVPADYDGDGDTDLAVFRPSNGRWYVLGQAAVSWGIATDIVAPGDYDGDGDTDVAVFRPSNGRWYVLGQPALSWGVASDIVVPGDYDGDGDVEPAVLRPAGQRWYPYGGTTINGFGQAGDIPVLQPRIPTP